MIKKLGTFNITSNVIRVTDPCYDRNVSCCGTVNNCKIGLWSAFLEYSYSGGWGTRVAENFVIFGDVSEDEAKNILISSNWKNSDISVGVDSVQCGIFDDSKYPVDETGEYGDDSSFYGKCCNLTLHSDQGGIMDFGVVSSSGYGDGSYDCLIAGDDKNIFAIRNIFIYDEDDEDEYDEDLE